MITRRLSILSAVLLGIGIYLLAAYCKGTAGLSLDFPTPGPSVKINAETTGLPAGLGLPFTVIGLLMVLISGVSALVAEVRSVFSRNKKEEPDATDAASDRPPA